MYFIAVSFYCLVEKPAMKVSTMRSTSWQASNDSCSSRRSLKVVAVVASPFFSSVSAGAALVEATYGAYCAGLLPPPKSGTFVAGISSFAFFFELGSS